MGDPKRRMETPSTSREVDAVAAVTLRLLERFDEETGETGIWIFGYGSLCWNPGFSFEKSLTGFVRGYSRKFWQGNTTHRGTQKRPGRVATLVEEEEGIVWGQAFQVKEKTAFSYLNNRECKLGGYTTIITTFYPRQNEDKRIKPFPAILYLATPSNSLWLGESPLAEIANQIMECTGSSGHNVEYLLKLATFVRENIPEAVDDHLFTLECLVRSHIKERNLCIKTLMGEKTMGKDDGGAGAARAKSGFQSCRNEPNRSSSTYFDSPLKKTLFCEYLKEISLFYVLIIILTVLENLPSVKTRYLLPSF